MRLSRKCLLVAGTVVVLRRRCQRMLPDHRIGTVTARAAAARTVCVLCTRIEVNSLSFSPADLCNIVIHFHRTIYGSNSAASYGSNSAAPLTSPGPETTSESQRRPLRLLSWSSVTNCTQRPPPFLEPSTGTGTGDLSDTCKSVALLCQATGETNAFIDTDAIAMDCRVTC
jgi:hypothetical protein